ncbi:MAG: T9SS type A sorting domain-containing protein [Bacteroidetes bacterium]|nr:T9SS type A sorting domain-containing protein [Bacteroidota bacterium]
MKKLLRSFLVTLRVLSVLLGISLIIHAGAFAEEFRYGDSWSKAGYSLNTQTRSNVVVNYSIASFSLEDILINGESMIDVQLPGEFLFNDEGAPNLPGSGRYIAVPQGATASVRIVNYRTETFKNVNIAPAPRIPWETEVGPLDYAKDLTIYNTDKFYPENPVKISDPDVIRGIDVVMLGVTPFQYNPVTRELLVYRDIEIEVIFDGGTDQFGDDRLRSRWWDPILSDVLLNYESLPKPDYNQSFQATEDMGCEYLIVTPTNPEFLQWADSIKQFRTLQGISTDVMTVEDCGGNNVNTLETFFNNAYNTWDVVPSAVLILGDYGTNSATSITSPIWNNYCVSDNIWADVTGNSMPDIIFARMTAQNAAQLEVMVTKFLDYERTPPTDPDFYNHPISALGFQTERWFQICSETVAGFWESTMGKETVRVNKTYIGNPLSDPWSTATNTSTVLNYFGPNGLGYIPATPGQVNCTWNGTAQNVVNAINAGSFMLQHRDHGFEQGWGEPAFTSSNINSLTNTDLIFVWSINCLTGKYNYSSEVFSEKFHRYTYNGQNSGALAINAASEVSYSFVNDTYVWGAYDNMWPNFMPTYGSEVDERGLLPAFAQAAGKYFLQASNWPYNTNNKEVTYNLFHHHGDAFTVVYSEVPMNLNVTHNPILYAGVTSFDVSANEGAFIALTVNGEIIGTAEGTGAPVSITIPGQVPPDQMVVTITKQNYYRYSANVEVIPPTGPYVVRESYTINDNTGGNGDGMMDYGESNMLSLTVENVGVQQAENVEVNLATTDEFITITDGTETYGNIAAGATLSVSDGFAYDVANDIPDGHQASFEVTATDGTDTWVSYFTIDGHAPVLEFVNFEIDDASGNNNGKIDPGETVDITIEIENSGSSEAFNIDGEISVIDPYLSVTAGTGDFGDLTGGSTATAVFSVAADESTPAGHLVTIEFDMEADLNIIGSGEFDVVIGQIPVMILNLDGNNNSAPGMEAALADMDVAYEVLNAFPPDLNLYSTIFVCLGIYSDNHVLSSSEGQALADYLDAGGNLYMEGGDTWYYDAQTAVHGMFNINGIADGSGDMGTVLGQSGTFTEGMTFSYGGDNSWMDRLEPIGAAETVLKNQSPSYATAIAYAEGSYNTIGASHEFGGLSDGSSPSTKAELMEAYLDFFGMSMSIQAMFSSNVTEVCVGGIVEYYDESSNSATSWDWTFEGGSPATSSAQNPQVMYANPGTYDVTLEVSDGVETVSITMENYISVLDAPGQAATPEGDEEICTNTILTTDYTTTGASDADSYIWEISPADAGTISGDDMTGTVEWTENWEGMAYISVKGINDCGEGDFSEEFEVMCSICTGIDELAGIEGVKIYPNPSTGQFTIRFGQDIGITHVQVVNLLSEVVYSAETETSNGNILEVNLQDFANGVYFVKLKNNTTESIQKIVIR